ncbi:MAG: hypothetical protein K6L73_08440 [Cellvibrionaceae bacterium]
MKKKKAVKDMSDVIIRHDDIISPSFCRELKLAFSLKGISDDNLAKKLNAIRVSYLLSQEHIRKTPTKNEEEEYFLEVSTVAHELSRLLSKANINQNMKLSDSVGLSYQELYIIKDKLPYLAYRCEHIAKTIKDKVATRPLTAYPHEKAISELASTYTKLSKHRNKIRGITQIGFIDSCLNEMQINHYQDNEDIRLESIKNYLKKSRKNKI